MFADFLDRRDKASCAWWAAQSIRAESKSPLFSCGSSGRHRHSGGTRDVTRSTDRRTSESVSQRRGRVRHRSGPQVGSSRSAYLFSRLVIHPPIKSPLKRLAGWAGRGRACARTEGSVRSLAQRHRSPSNRAERRTDLRRFVGMTQGGG